METRNYYSVRTGTNSGAMKLDLPKVLRLFIAIYKEFENKGYFQEAFGYYCVDNDNVAGSAGSDIESFFLRKIRKEGLWPVLVSYQQYSEEDLFDVIELLFDLVSQPIQRPADYHSYGNCGWHYSQFDRNAGQKEYRTAINAILKDYNDGFELSEKGEVLTLPDTDMTTLITAQIPTTDTDNIENRIRSAILKYRSFRSSLSERKEAVRDLADVLEFLKPKIEKVLSSKDEKDLFNIANNFAIRHHNVHQKRDYDEAIWLSWMFYFYLATIHAVLRFIEKKKSDTGGV